MKYLSILWDPSIILTMNFLKIFLFSALIITASASGGWAITCYTDASCVSAYNSGYCCAVFGGTSDGIDFQGSDCLLKSAISSTFQYYVNLYKDSYTNLVITGACTSGSNPQYYI